MERLIEGYHRFREEGYEELAELFRSLAEEQHPTKLFITCSDSRLLPDRIVSALPGELFVIRNAGNIVPPYHECVSGMGGTLEFAVRVLGVRHIIVCGHTNCGAIQALVHPDLVKELPLLREWLAHAGLETNAPEDAGAGGPDEGGPSTPEPGAAAGEEAELNRLSERNVLTQLRHLETFPCVRERLDAGSLSLHGWVFDIPTGRIRAFDPESRRFVDL